MNAGLVEDTLSIQHTTLFHIGRIRILTIHPTFPGLMASKKESRNILPISLRIENSEFMPVSLYRSWLAFFRTYI